MLLSIPMEFTHGGLYLFLLNGIVMLVYSGNIAIMSLDLWQFKHLLLFFFFYYSQFE